MTGARAVECRVVACREILAEDGDQWSFYLVNDGAAPIALARLGRIAYEWGDLGHTQLVSVEVRDLAPGASARIWRDDGDGAEVRMELVVDVSLPGHNVQLSFEFPKLYRLRDLPVVAPLAKPGFAVAAHA